MTKPYLSLQNVCLMRGNVRLFAPLSFTLNAGEVLHLQGQNGQGKSTLLQAINGLFPLHTGHIESRVPCLYLGHRLAINQHLSTVDNLRFNALLYENVSLDTAAEQALLAKLNLSTRQHIKAARLSQGERMRLALSRLFISRAKCWLLDEPFSGLDSSSKALLLTQFDKHQQQGGAILFTSHQPIDLLGVKTIQLTGLV